MARGRRLHRKRSPVPLRRCIACREQREASALLRLAAVGGRTVLDAARQWGGRGCWMCRSEACAVLAAKGKVARALKGKGGQPDVKALLGWVREGPSQGPSTVPSLDGGVGGG